MSDQEKNELNISTSWNAYNEQCPTRLMLNRIADKWAVLLLGLLERETKRFSTLQRETGGISQKMLTQTLRSLERDGLIQRTVYASVPPKVEYSITPLGFTLVAPLAAIRVWSETHIEEVLAAQSAYDKAQDSEQQRPNVRKIVFN
ncbi:helix-turn-helix domain-containing protein [Methylophilus sp. Q8]|uniref:winged helix-turn-helix transcriptional regulator n=1 Tax=Methylophilus sp. Q8 TaxID=1506586 RepID=UPI000648D773|nr:helix-turn-helix domain-containing protein [Methylophilus sp. Q8]